MASTVITTNEAIRLVPNTREQYRYLNEDELVEGVTAWMVDIDQLPVSLDDLKFAGKTEVTVDRNPLFDNYGTPSVRYHCTRPAWEGQCFAPIATFTTGFDDRDVFPCPGPRHEYWVPNR